MHKAYKVFVVEDGCLKNLFKGIEGTRTIEFNTWLRAENKMSVDGSGQDPYLTGIHCLLDKDKAIDYLDNFRTDKNRIVLEVKVDGIRQKPTNRNVYLADWLYVDKDKFDTKLKEVISY